MGASNPNFGVAPVRPHLHAHHRYYLNLQHFCPRHRSSTSTRATRNDELTERQEASSLPARRHLLLPLGAGTISGILRCPFLSLGLGLGLDPPLLAEESSPSPDYTITDKVYLEITKCPSLLITNREGGPVSTEGRGTMSSLPMSAASTSTFMSYKSTSTSTPSLPSLGTSTPTSTSTSTLSPLQRALSTSPALSSPYCNDGELLGRIVIGLYGKQVPVTVAHFKAMCTGEAGSSYKGSLIHRILAGQYIMAGKQGFSKEKGEVVPPAKLDRNVESIKSESFKMQHLRPGTVSLCLSENDDEDQFKLDTDYRNVEFLITTGPGPAPQLDNKNIIFGTVLEGLDVVLASAAVPTYKPSERIRQFNELASFLGDERASNARSIWNRPLKALYISDCGEI